MLPLIQKNVYEYFYRVLVVLHGLLDFSAKDKIKM